MRRRVWALGGAVLLAAAGCGGKGGSHAAGDPGTTRATTVSVPAVITTSYVNQVLARLNVVYSDALRISLTTRQITPQVKTDLRAIYANPLYQQELNGFKLQLRHIPADLRKHVGNRVTIVNRILSVSPSCIFVSTTDDFSQIVRTPGRPFAVEYYSLISKSKSDDPERLNPTLWEFGYNFASYVKTKVANPCQK